MVDDRWFSLAGERVVVNGQMLAGVFYEQDQTLYLLRDDIIPMVGDKVQARQADFVVTSLAQDSAKRFWKLQLRYVPPEPVGMTDKDFNTETPGDRLIYADWLEEQGRHADSKVQRIIATIESGELDDPVLENLKQINDAVSKRIRQMAVKFDMYHPHNAVETRYLITGTHSQ